MVRFPARTTIMLAPLAAMRSSIAAWAGPRPAMLITAATPMIMPRMVSSVRSRFRRSARIPTATPRPTPSILREIV